MLYFNIKEINKLDGIVGKMVTPTKRLFGIAVGEANYVSVTHCGRFHSDDIFCTALDIILRYPERDPILMDLNFIKTIIPSFLKRMNEIDESVLKGMDIDQCLVYDLRGGHADHHDMSKLIYRDEAIVNVDYKPCYASFGVMWNVLGIGNIFNIGTTYTKDVKERLDKELVYNIDMIDNYGPKCPVADGTIPGLISNYNMYGSDDLYNSGFVMAVKMAYDILYNAIAKAQADVKSVIKLMEHKELIKKNSAGTMYIDIPAEDDPTKRINVNVMAASELEINGEKPLFLINRNPNERNGKFNLVCIDATIASIGKVYLSYIPKGCSFIHDRRFMASFNSEKELFEFANGLKLIDGELIY